MTVAIRRPRDRRELQAAFALREEVFCGEQGVALGAERDEHDASALHLVAVADGGPVQGTCRIVLAGGGARFGRLVVARDARGRGLGASLLAAAEREARAAGARRMRLHAQLRARALYARAGYEERGEPFDEEGIPHIAMEKDLA